MDERKFRTWLGILGIVAVTFVAMTEGFNGRVILTSIVMIAGLGGLEITGIVDTLFGRRK